jgi:hypothetical protein
MIIEQALRTLGDRLAAIRHYANTAAAAADERPEPAALSGLADMVGDAHEILTRVRAALADQVEVLDLEIAPADDDDDEQAAVVRRRPRGQTRARTNRARTKAQTTTATRARRESR